MTDTTILPLAPHGEVIPQRFTLTFDYPVFFTRDVFLPANPVLAAALSWNEDRHTARRVAFYLDAGAAGAVDDLPGRIERFVAARPELELAGPVRVLPGGEAVKNDPGLIERIQRELLAIRLDRHNYLAAVGGGAFLDALGFAAATFHRGVRHVRIPTTVLAQNDSGVGVKNGINGFGVKNLIGTFQPPWAVINDAAFLDGLPEREKRGGLAEAVKVALIRDPDFFAWLQAKAPALAAFEPGATDEAIRRCALLHMRQIAHGGDPFERGSVRPLDFGHWAAHKLEALSGHELRHGEAVAIGIALDTIYSVLAGLLPAGREEPVLELLARLGFALWHPALLARSDAGGLAVLDGLREFREHLGGELTVTFLAELGRGVEVHAVSEALMSAAIDRLRAASGNA